MLILFLKLKNPLSNQLYIYLEAIKLIFNVYEDKENLINMQCAKYKLTQDFMIYFSSYVTPESFSKSPDLEYDMIHMYPEFFDMKAWVESTEKSLEPLLNPDFLRECGTSVDEAINNANPAHMTKEVYNKFEGILSSETKEKVLSQSDLIKDTEFLVDNAEFLTKDIFRNRSFIKEI